MLGPTRLSMQSQDYEEVGMDRRGMLSVVLAVWIAVPAVALGAVARPREVSTLGDPVVHATPDRVA
jgi:hypothetical protein